MNRRQVRPVERIGHAVGFAIVYVALTIAVVLVLLGIGWLGLELAGQVADAWRSL